MLTDKQIEAARTVVIVLSVAQCGETPEIGADERDLLLTSLSAYERVVSLLATLESTPCDPRLGANAVREQIIAALRVALRGE